MSIDGEDVVALPRGSAVIAHSAQTDVGRARQMNEDAFLARAPVYLVAEEPDRHRSFLTKLTGSTPEAVTGGLSFRCAGEALRVLNPSRLDEIAPGTHFDLSDGPQFAGFSIEVTGPAPPLTPASEACGAFIEWRRV